MQKYILLIFISLYCACKLLAFLPVLVKYVERKKIYIQCYTVYLNLYFFKSGSFIVQSEVLITIFEYYAFYDNVKVLTKSLHKLKWYYRPADLALENLMFFFIILIWGEKYYEFYLYYPVWNILFFWPCSILTELCFTCSKLKVLWRKLKLPFIGSLGVLRDLY